MESRHSGAQTRKMTRSGTLRRFSSDEGRQHEVLPISINEEDWERYQAKARLLFPLGTLKFRWDWLVLLLILYSSVAVPFRLGMGHPADDFWWYLEMGISLAFITDIVFNFNTAYVDGDQLVLDKTMIRDNYLRTWFAVDLLSSVPVELIDLLVISLLGGDDNDEVQSHLSLRMLRAMRLFRLLRLLGCSRSNATSRSSRISSISTYRSSTSSR